METRLQKTKATKKGISSALALLLVLSSLGLASQAMGITCQQYLIGDTVWYDTNQNAQREAGEKGIPGVLLELFNGTTMQPVLNSSGQPVTTVTDDNGHYQFQVYGKCEELNPNYGLPGEPQYITYYDGVYAVHVAASNFDALKPGDHLACTTGSVWIKKTVIDQDIYDLLSTSQFDFGAVKYATLLDCPNPFVGSAGVCTVFQLDRGKVSFSSGDATGVTGNVCIAGTGKLSMSGGQIITGKAYLASTAILGGLSGSTKIIGGVVPNVALSAEKNSALAAASSAAALPCDQTLANLSGVSTISPSSGKDGAQNVICVGKFEVASDQTVTLTGSSNTSYIFNVTGTFKVNGGKTGGKVLAGDPIQATHVLYNVLGTGGDVVLDGRWWRQCRNPQGGCRWHHPGSAAASNFEPRIGERADCIRDGHQSINRGSFVQSICP